MLGESLMSLAASALHYAVPAAGGGCCVMYSVEHSVFGETKAEHFVKRNDPSSKSSEELSATTGDAAAIDAYAVPMKGHGQRRKSFPF
mmetsp:Transcript_47838/g.144705  ORF Transcript_47838/g.144705 Transcript_47838/m.144705 type:complete len:88 (+) Transcript_47838:1971-2234(+)